MIIDVIRCFSGSSHNYWRVFCSDNWDSSDGIAIEEVEFLDAGGSVIAPTGGTAIGSDDQFSTEFYRAFDSTAGTYWHADASNANQWVGYHFGTSQAVAKVRLKSVSSGSGLTRITRQPKNCKLEYSDDGSSWTTAFSFFSVAVVGGVQTFPESPPSGFHKFWRVFCADNNGGTSLIILDEIELRATAGGGDQTAGMGDNFGNSTARVIGNSLTTAGNEGWRAFNNITDSANDWAGNGITNMWIGAVFPEAVKVEEVSLKCGNTTNDRNRAPKNMTIDYSDDGTSWTTQKTLAPQTAWGVNEVRVLAAI